MTYEEALSYAIEGEAVFLTGSGFSIGAYNGIKDSDNSLWIGSQLAKNMAKELEMDEDIPLDIISQEYIEMY